MVSEHYNDEVRQNIDRIADATEAIAVDTDNLLDIESLLTTTNTLLNAIKAQTDRLTFDANNNLSTRIRQGVNELGINSSGEAAVQNLASTPRLHLTNVSATGCLSIPGSTFTTGSNARCLGIVFVVDTNNTQLLLNIGGTTSNILGHTNGVDPHKIYRWIVDVPPNTIVDFAASINCVVKKLIVNEYQQAVGGQEALLPDLAVDSIINLNTGLNTRASENTLATLNGKFVNGNDIGDVTINNASGASAVNIQDGGNSLTVDAVDLDIRNLSSTQDTIGAVKSGLWTLDANSGVDIGDVTVNNTGGASAVNIQDGGNIISVDDANGSLTIDNVNLDAALSTLSKEATLQLVNTSLDNIEADADSTRIATESLDAKATVVGASGSSTAAPLTVDLDTGNGNRGLLGVFFNTDGADTIDLQASIDGISYGTVLTFTTAGAEVRIVEKENPWRYIRLTSSTLTSKTFILSAR